MLKLLILLTIFSIAGSEKIYKHIQMFLDLEPGIDNDSSFQVYPKLQEKCAKNSDCSSIPYSICSLGKCTCKRNYITSNERCLGLLEEECELDDDCGVENSTCHSGFCRRKTDFQSQDVTKCHQVPKLAPEIQKPKLGANCSDDSECPRTSICLGTCQCLETHYAKDNHCYGFSPRLGFPAHSSAACRYLKNSVYSSGFCQCASEYIENNGKCIGKVGTNCLEDSECALPSVCSGTCQCPENHFSKNEKCYRYPEKLYSNCSSDDQCKIPFSECSSGQCKCKRGYAEHENKCYGLAASKCNLSKDCAGLIFTCKSGSCTEVFSTSEGILMSSKPGTTAIWQPYLNLWSNPERHDHHLGEPGHHPGPEKAGNLAWVKDFTLDKVVLVKSWMPSAYPSFIDIWCRAKTTTGEFTSGKVRIPGDRLCKYEKNGTKHSTDDWAALVDLGPTE